MARKQHLINVHTSTSTTAPEGASLYLGEIAVQHTPNEPALWIKMGSAQTSTDYEKFIGETEILSLIENSKILGSGYTYSGLPYVNSATTIADAYSALTNEVILNEKVGAAALNVLNGRVNEISANTSDIEELINENEEIVAGALNVLSDRIGTVETQMMGDYIPITGYELASGTSEEELALTEEDTVNEAFGKLQKQMLDNEEAVAAGFNYFNGRIDDIEEEISHNTGVTALSGAVVTIKNNLQNLSGATEELSANTASFIEAVVEVVGEINSNVSQLSGAVESISAKTSGVLTLNLNGVEQGKYSPSADTTINLEAIQEITGADVLLTGYELASGSTEEELVVVATDTVNEAIGKLQKQNYDNEAVVAGALNVLDERITALSASVVEEVSALTANLDTLSGAVVSNEYVIAQAFNNVNDRITALEGDSSLTALSASVVDSQSDILELSGAVASVGYLEEITWPALKTKRDGGTLTPGMWYRITDYNTTTTQADTQAAGHQFDIIVLATDVNKLSEEARAIRHAGDAYFSAATLEGWKIWYCLDNDTTRFAWADTNATGRGVIYRMIDEWNNDVPYDFKNIQFKRKLDGGEYDPEDGTDTWVYTFTWVNENYEVDDLSIVGNSLENDEGQYSGIHDNVIKPVSAYEKIFPESPTEFGIALNDIVFISSYSYESGLFYGCYNNIFGGGCRNNTFGNNCRNNTFGNNCYNNTFGNDCESNTFGNGFHDNTFGNDCEFNTFGNSCSYNTFGTDCLSSIFGSNCNFNTFGNNCRNNTFGNFCYNNTFGNDCYGNTLGNYCDHIKFGNSSTTKSYYHFIIVENGNSCIYLYCSATTSGSQPYRNVKIAQGVNNTSSWKTITDSNVNQEYQTTYQATNSQTINI